MKFYITASAYSVMGQVHVQAQVRELQPSGPCTLLYTATTLFPDDGTDDPREYLRSALSGLMEYVYDDTPRTMSTWGVPKGAM